MMMDMRAPAPMQGGKHGGKRILVAGGAGFIGSHLCARLLREGHEVICLDSLRTGSLRNIAALSNHPGFTLVRHDVIVPYEARDIDQIYNLACPASPVHYQIDPVHTLRSCVEGAIRLLDLAQRTGARILQASTSEVYGDPHVHPQREDYWGNVNPVGPRSCYDEGKRCAETLFLDYGRQNGLSIKIARIFNTYGPHMAVGDGRVVSNLIVQALGGQPLTLYGDGRQTRAFCYVDDLVEGLVRLMNSPAPVTGPVNLGNPQEISMLTLARHVLREVGKDEAPPIQFRELPVDDPTQRCPDIALARSTLGWQPRIDLETGLRRTVAYFRQLGLERIDAPVQPTPARDFAAS
ncbi:UDP-glucuronic acid decarboxylase family protein [Achromobacter aloeverae]|uniref:NAD-dependent dehydratase n=1 Tax=Achromobacter aloeverae TaxID=1750518 RepID=A0A4Q1HGC6_9BURK|nr:UDP-glucuronic acid decarboxylase family protein [Achromobacter aloeverae]RXN86169.1 NAD-dependent dehydratase [Achromobacter aloeverae]